MWAGVLLLGAAPAGAASRWSGPPGTCDTAPAPTQGAPWPRTGASAVVLESDHFVLTYYTSGRDSLHRPTLPGEALQDFETAYTVLSTDPRSRLHVPYGTNLERGPEGKINVEIGTPFPGYNGTAYWTSITWRNDLPCANTSAGYILLSHDLRGRSEIRLIAAHELMHLFQYAMNPNVPDWITESTARWAEGFVFPADKRRVDSFASFTHHTTAMWNGRESKIYSPHFWDVLDRLSGEPIPPRVWAHVCSLEAMPAIGRTLAARGTSLDMMLHRYAVWNYYTGQRSDAAHDFRTWLPEIRPDAEFAQYPVVGSTAVEPYAEESGSNYLFFSGPASRENLRIRLEGTDRWRAHRKVTWIGTTGTRTHVEVTPRDSTAAEFVIPRWHGFDRVAVVVTNGVDGGVVPPQELRYTVTATEEGVPVQGVAWVPSNEVLRVANPARGGAAIRYRVEDGSQRASIRIYDVRGRLLHHIEDGVRPPGDYGAYWDGMTPDGRAAAGTYVLRLQTGDISAVRRFVLLR